MSVPPVEGAGTAENQAKRVEIVVSAATVLKAAVIALRVFLAIVANEVLLTIGLAFVFALGLDPLVGWFTRRGVGRGKASLLVFGLLFLIGAAIVISGTRSAISATTCRATSTTSRTSRSSGSSTRTRT